MRSAGLPRLRRCRRGAGAGPGRVSECRGRHSPAGSASSHSLWTRRVAGRDGRPEAPAWRASRCGAAGRPIGDPRDAGCPSSDADAMGLSAPKSSTAGTGFPPVRYAAYTIAYEARIGDAQRQFLLLLSPHNGRTVRGLTTECSEPRCQSSIVAMAITTLRDVCEISRLSPQMLLDHRSCRPGQPQVG